MYNIINYKNQKKNYKFYLFENCRLCEYFKSGNIWEPHVLKVFDEYLNKDSVCIDAGAHVGYHTIYMSSIVQRVHAFECNNKTYEKLRKNIQSNHINNVDLYKYGLTDKITNDIYLEFCNQSNTGASGLSNNPMGKPEYIKPLDKKQSVKMMTIDDLNLSKLDFIKIDVEGYERKVIDGAMKTIKKYKPVILMEVWENHHGVTSLEHTLKLFDDLLEIYNIIRLELTCDYLFIKKE